MNWFGTYLAASVAALALLAHAATAAAPPRPALTRMEQKLVGSWTWRTSGERGWTSVTLQFRGDGTFRRIEASSCDPCGTVMEGRFSYDGTTLTRRFAVWVWTERLTFTTRCGQAGFVLGKKGPLFVLVAEQRALDAITRCGGQFQRDDKKVGQPVVAVTFASAGPWTSTRFPRVTDAVVKELAALKHLRELDLSWAQVTDAGLKELTSLKGLQALDLSFTEVTDAGLRELKDLENLRELRLHSLKVTDKGLEHLKSLSRLQKLGLYGTKVTDKGAASLQRAMPRLKVMR
jgi:Leucine Rich repeat